mmetsp:Transcript_38356/g.83578  ORF Transcript_38356/g.83578 Transcript_38356/m.83578 type:complete len:234 (+) Transcript_38356:312-1013(+)
MAPTPTPAALPTAGNGLMTCRTATAVRIGPTGQPSRASSARARSMAGVASCGAMVAFTRASSSTTTCMARAPIVGATAGCTPANGPGTIWAPPALCSGRMAGSMRGTFRRGASTGRARIGGPTGAPTVGSGKRASSTEPVWPARRRAWNVEAIGRTASFCNGWIRCPRRGQRARAARSREVQASRSRAALLILAPPAGATARFEAPGRLPWTRRPCRIRRHRHLGRTWGRTRS